MFDAAMHATPNKCMFGCIRDSDHDWNESRSNHLSTHDHVSHVLVAGRGRETSLVKSWEGGWGVHVKENHLLVAGRVGEPC